jgi:hypothetical protein
VPPFTTGHGSRAWCKISTPPLPLLLSHVELHLERWLPARRQLAINKFVRDSFQHMLLFRNEKDFCHCKRLIYMPGKCGEIGITIDLFTCPQIMHFANCGRFRGLIVFTMRVKSNASIWWQPKSLLQLEIVFRTLAVHAGFQNHSATGHLYRDIH